MYKRSHVEKKKTCVTYFNLNTTNEGNCIIISDTFPKKILIELNSYMTYYCNLCTS